MMKRRTEIYMHDRKCQRMLQRVFLKNGFVGMNMVRLPRYPAGTGSYLHPVYPPGFEITMANPEVLNNIPVIAPSE